MSDETTGADTQGETPTTPATWDDYMAAQSEEIRALYETQTSGLKSALTSEREQRKGLAKELREATAKVAEGSDTRKALDEITQRYERAEKRASFFEEAGQSDVGCVNPKAAYLVASADDLYTRSGDPDWKAIREAAPELFQRNATTVNAGAGTGQAPPVSTGMNEFIRLAAGRG